MTIAEDSGADYFDLVYDFTQTCWDTAFAAANTWDGTGEPVGYVRRLPPLEPAVGLVVMLDPREDEETWPGVDND